ncbi:hypothetical protein [Psychromonas aquimarina]|uniref:hypothetical protein n=1 Tax=Psychromonas aquimarina TaxID=444919 RepID=UPI0004128604|nr:hypothetical protein [Psychromonas aquimarina]
MVNINAHLPPAVAAAFHPPTESLQRDNIIKPVIPKTEIISSYTKLREDESRTQFSDQARGILQNEEEQKTDSDEQQESSPQRRRSQFFARRSELSGYEAENGDGQLTGISDFKLVMSVIQARYKDAVSPLPDPTVSYAI